VLNREADYGAFVAAALGRHLDALRPRAAGE
jgi:hypothetical protein